MEDSLDPADGTATQADVLELLVQRQVEWMKDAAERGDLERTAELARGVVAVIERGSVIGIVGESLAASDTIC